MELEAVQAELRPRAPYEALDLGVLLLRHAAAPALRAWLAYVLPLQVLAMGLGWYLFGPAWASVLVWWLKPVYDRVVLVVLSRELFGERPGVAAVGRVLGSQRVFSWLGDLTVRRLSPFRSLVLPVRQLEGLTGRAASQRADALSRGVSSVAVTALSVCAALEWMVAGGLAAGVVLLIPEEVGIEWAELLVGPELGTDLLAWASGLLYGISVMLVEPLYVACGFGLYINRRTELEGWDVELAFRRLSARLARAATLVLVFVLSLGAVGGARAQDAAPPGEWLPTPVPSAEPSEHTRVRAQAAIGEVMAREDLVRRETISHWEPREWAPEQPAPQDGEMPAWLADFLRAFENLTGFADVVRLLLWLSFALVVLRVAWALWRLFRAQLPATDAVVPTAASLSYLPEEARDVALSGVVAAAEAALERDERARALGLLYGGALRTFVERDGLTLPVSATEAECLRRVRGAGRPDAAAKALFERLTRAWVQAAYAHRIPEVTEVRSLCSAYVHAVQGQA